MKGFEIETSMEQVSASVDEGLVFVWVNCIGGECFVSVLGRDLKNKRKLVWLDRELSIGETVKVVFDDVKEASVPARVVDVRDEPVKQKLQRYNWAKSYLKERGLI